MPVFLAMLLATHVDLCICAPTCCVQGAAPVTLATDAPESGRECCSETPARPCCEKSASEEDDSCCDCCMDSPLSRPPNDGGVGSEIPSPCHDGAVDNLVPLARAVTAVPPPPARSPARYGPPLYLQFEVLRT